MEDAFQTRTEDLLNYGIYAAGILLLGCILFALSSAASLAAVHHIYARARAYIRYILSWIHDHRREIPIKPVISYGLFPLLGTGMALCCIIRFGTTPACCVWIAFLAVLAGVTLVDIKTMEIPDFFPVAAFLLGIVAIWACPETGIVSRLIGFACISLPMLGLALLVEGGFGGGDIKLMAGCGFLLGWKLTLLSAFIGILGGGLYGIGTMIFKKHSGKEHFAFGPFLAAGMAVCCFYGNELIDIYLRIFDLSRYL